VRDTTLYEDLAGTTSNGSGLYFLAGRDGNGAVRRGLVYFDVSGAIPHGSTIISATLSLSSFYSQDDTPRSVELHRLLTDWGEGTSTDNPGGPGNGGNATPGDATWVHTFFPSQVWNTPGGDFDISISGAADVAGARRLRLDGEADARRRAAVAGRPHEHFGWLLRGEESAPYTSKGFFTHERGGDTGQPLLTVEYTPHAPPVIESCVPDPTTLCLDDAPGDQRFAVRGRLAISRLVVGEWLYDFAA
jgi:hypothetical protein